MSNLDDEEVEWEDVDDEWEVQCKEGGLTDRSLDDAFAEGDDSLALGTDTGEFVLVHGLDQGLRAIDLSGMIICLYVQTDSRCLLNIHARETRLNASASAWWWGTKIPAVHPSFSTLFSIPNLALSQASAEWTFAVSSASLCTLTQASLIHLQISPFLASYHRRTIPSAASRCHQGPEIEGAGCSLFAHTMPHGQKPAIQPSSK